jgi:hypothetical protein
METECCEAGGSETGGGADVEGQGRSPLARALDRLIIILMVAIVLLMSWPVCQVLWQQTHPRQALRSAPQPVAAPQPTPAAKGASDVA